MSLNDVPVDPMDLGYIQLELICIAGGAWHVGNLVVYTFAGLVRVYKGASRVEPVEEDFHRMVSSKCKVM